MNRIEKFEKLIDELESINFDVREMDENQIKQYLLLKYKLLDFGLVFLNKNDAEEDHLENGSQYSDNQWDYILENLFAEKEYYYLECFFRSCLINFHKVNFEVFPNIKVSSISEL